MPVMTVRANAFCDIELMLSVTCTVKLKVPTLDVVPLMVPLEVRFSPLGSAPATNCQVYGEVPPLATKVTLYATPAVPCERGEEVVMARVLAEMRSCRFLLAESIGLIPSVTTALKVVLIAVAEVPVSNPLLLRLKPPGRPVADHV
jgi:hypothetical protein